MTTLLSVVFSLAIASPSVAHDSGSWEHTNHYLRAKVIKLSGGDRTAPGCDLVASRCDGKDRSQRNVHKYFETMRGMIAASAAPPVLVETYPESSSAQTSTSPPVASASSEGYAIPEHIVMCESGGDYNASNPSGAYGAYQIMPGTSAAYGCDMSTPAGQDACAAKIYAAEGSSPWVCG